MATRDKSQGHAFAFAPIVLLYRAYAKGIPTGPLPGKTYNFPKPEQKARPK